MFAVFCFATVAGVHDGYVLTKSISRSPVGGKLLNSCLQKSLEARGIQVKPRQTFKRVEKKPGEFVVRSSMAYHEGQAGAHSRPTARCSHL